MLQISFVREKVEPINHCIAHSAIGFTFWPTFMTQAWFIYTIVFLIKIISATPIGLMSAFWKSMNS